MFNPSAITDSSLFIQQPEVSLQTDFTALGADATSSRALVFVDQRVANYQQLVADTNAEVIVLDSQRSGLAQISQALAGRTGVSELHILSHGGEGDLLLGQGQVNGSDLDANVSEIAGWASALTGDADILLYGCNVAGSAAGLEFVRRLGELSGTDVAASDDLTGAAALGGDWDLEVETGAIDSDMPWSQLAAASYGGTLATLTVTATNDAAVSASNLAGAQADGTGLTLREAILFATAGDQITFASAGIVTLTQEELSIDKSLTINGDLNKDGKADVTVTRLQGEGASEFRIFNISAASGTNVALEGLAITGGKSTNNSGGGLYITGDGGTVTLTNNTVSGNTVSGNSSSGGGGLYITGNGGTVTLSNNTVSGNSSPYVGGGLFIERIGGTVTLSNNTVSGNSSPYVGGLFINGTDGTVTLSNNTVSGNSASTYGGLFIRGDNGTFTLSNNAVSGNFASQGGREMYVNGLLGTGGSATNNLFGYNGDGGVGGLITLDNTNITPGGALSTIFAVDSNGKPLLANNGGPTQTIALATGSAAINAANANAPTTDQRGFNRNGVADIGAFEFNGTAPNAPVVSNTPTIGRRRNQASRLDSRPTARPSTRRPSRPGVTSLK